MTLPRAEATKTNNLSKEDIEITSFSKNSTEKILVKIIEWKCQSYIDIRVWFASNGKDFSPSKKGITLSAGLVPKLIEALQKADKILKESKK